MPFGQLRQQRPPQCEHQSPKGDPKPDPNFCGNQEAALKAAYAQAMQPISDAEQGYNSQRGLR